MSPQVLLTEDITTGMESATGISYGWGGGTGNCKITQNNGSEKQAPPHETGCYSCTKVKPWFLRTKQEAIRLEEVAAYKMLATDPCSPWND